MYYMTVLFSHMNIIYQDSTINETTEGQNNESCSYIYLLKMKRKKKDI